MAVGVHPHWKVASSRRRADGEKWRWKIRKVSDGKRKKSHDLHYLPGRKTAKCFSVQIIVSTLTLVSGDFPKPRHGWRTRGLIIPRWRRACWRMAIKPNERCACNRAAGRGCGVGKNKGKLVGNYSQRGNEPRRSQNRSL